MKTTTHRDRQIEVINTIQTQIRNNRLQSSIVAPIDDFDHDSRICLTSVHIPSKQFSEMIQQALIKPLKIIDSHHYYYEPSSIHMTIKNVRTISDPPDFSARDIEKTKQVFSRIIPSHNKFNVYYYRLLLFPFNLSLMGTTNPELDNIILDLDRELNAVGVPDNKQYANKRHFFSNVTLVRFLSPITDNFKKTVEDLSASINFPPYTVDSVTLLTANAALKKRKIIGSWQLKNR